MAFVSLFEETEMGGRVKPLGAQHRSGLVTHCEAIAPACRTASGLRGKLLVQGCRRMQGFSETSDDDVRGCAGRALP